MGLMRSVLLAGSDSRWLREQADAAAFGAARRLPLHARRAARRRPGGRGRPAAPRHRRRPDAAGRERHRRRGSGRGRGPLPGRPGAHRPRASPRRSPSSRPSSGSTSMPRAATRTCARSPSARRRSATSCGSTWSSRATWTRRSTSAGACGRSGPTSACACRRTSTGRPRDVETLLADGAGDPPREGRVPGAARSSPSRRSGTWTSTTSPSRAACCRRRAEGRRPGGLRDARPAVHPGDRRARGRDRPQPARARIPPALRHPARRAAAPGARRARRARPRSATGSYWFPWYMRRLAERPANVWFVVKSLVRAPDRADDGRPCYHDASGAAGGRRLPTVALSRDSSTRTGRRGCARTRCSPRRRRSPLRRPAALRRAGGPGARRPRAAGRAGPPEAPSTAPRLDAADRISYDMLARELRDDITDHEFGAWRLPINADSGFHTGLAQLPRTRRSSTTRDYENYLARLRAFPAYVAPADRQHARGPAHRLHAAARRARRLRRRPSAPTSWTIPSRASSTRLPRASRPASPRRTARGCARPAASAVMRGRGRGLSRVPRLHDRRVPPRRARTTIAAAELPRGREYYAHRVRNFTTLDVTPEEVHQIGLRRGRAHPRRDGDGHRRRPASRATSRLPRVPAHRPALLREDAGGAAEAGVARSPSGWTASCRRCSAACRACPTASSPCPRTSRPSTPAGRYVEAPVGGTRAGTYWVNTYAPREPAALRARGADPARGRARPSPPDRAAAGAGGPARVPPRVAGSARSSRAGASTRSASASRPASTRTRTATSAGSPTRCGAPAAWSWTPGMHALGWSRAAGDRLHGRATPRSRCTRCAPRSTATSPGPARPSPTRWAS